MGKTLQSKFQIGTIVKHKLFNYRGIIADIDPYFIGDESWYELMAKTKPAKNKPWYYILVDNSMHITYVPECNLAKNVSSSKISHPEIDNYFIGYKNGKYIPKSNA